MNGVFTPAQAKKRAQQIFDEVGQLIHDACVGTNVAESFLAGFTGVEAAFDTHGPELDSKRFEPGVYAHLIGVRDGLHHSYDNITTRDLLGMSDDAIRNLATSWGCTQIMGWHLIHNLKGTVSDLRDPDKHFYYTAQLLKLVGGSYMKRGDLTSVLHIWNTGSANGKTYHEAYVDNALNVKAAYEKLVAAKPFTASAAAVPPSDEPDPPPSGSTGSSQTTDPQGTQPPVISTPGPSWWARMTDYQGKLDQVSSFRNSLSPFTPSLSPISGMSWMMTVTKVLGGWAMLILGMIASNGLYIAAGMVLLAIGAAIFICAKRNAASRNAPAPQVQQQTVEVKT